MRKISLSLLFACVFCLAGVSVKAQSRFMAPYDLEGGFIQYDPSVVYLSWKSEAPASDVPEDLYWDLETMIEDWTLIDADGDGVYWRHVQGLECPSGYICLISESKDCYGDHGGIAYTPDNYIITPKLPIVGNAIFSFMACSADAFHCQEHFGVAISTTGNTDDADFTTLDEWTIMPGKLNQTPWLEYSVDLSAYAGQEVYIALRHFGCTDQYALAIDDIRLTYNPVDLESFNVYRSTTETDDDYQLIANVPAVENQTSYEYFDNVDLGTYNYHVTAVYTSEGETEPAFVRVSFMSLDENDVNVAVYPNPTRGLLKVESVDMKQITVINALGQVVYNASVESDEVSIDMSQLSAGMYILRVDTENGVSTRQFNVVK